MFNNKQEFVDEFTKRIEENFGRSVAQSHPTERFMVLGQMIRDFAGIHWKQTKEKIAQEQAKQMYYFSMEFLIGRMLTNNLMNLGIYELVRDGLKDLGMDINELEELESDAGLGNGGLGRLAACFLDSLASLQLPGNGNCIRYQYGLFRQKIENGYQVEVPDQWLRLGNVWEVRKPKSAVDVCFWGHIEMRKDENGRMIFDHVDAEHVLAVPYDMPVVGHGTKETNTLRLWSAEASDIIPTNKDFRLYLQELQEICLNVYPDDSTDAGKILRLKQQYFFVSAGVSSIIRSHLNVYPTLDNLADKVAIQLNDTHPVLAIPELMRILMDDYGYAWEQAWEITTGVMAYTNHTILSEALEKWPVSFVQRLLPRIYMIIEEINRRFMKQIGEQFPNEPDMAYRMAIIKEDQVHMASLAIAGSHSVNGVAQLHTDILVNDLFRDFVRLWPQKFNNKTNGITHRRWLLYSNPQLRAMLKDLIGEEYEYDLDQIEKLMDKVDDPQVQRRFMQIKRERKVILAQDVKKRCGIEIDPDSIFDVQAKRLHAYKRQLLNALHIIYLYQRMKEDPSFTIRPTTFLFAAKAAPAYYFAKKVIKLINSLAEVINQDPRISRMMKVVFIPNYSVSIAEVLMNAADVSEQISTAGKEASGTGNMKFMMNGALTLGTLDGANVEIDARVGRENDVIFGLTVEQVEQIRPHYNAWDYYNGDIRIRKAMDSLVDGTWSQDLDEFRMIFDEVMYKNDEYLLLADFDSYVRAHEEIQRRYQDSSGWARSCLINIAKSGYFTSDRTIRQYAEEIWNIQPVHLDDPTKTV